MPTGGGGGGGGTPTGWPVGLFTQIGVSAFTAPTTNKVGVTGIWVPSSITFSHIAVELSVSDAVNNYDLGLYTQAGVLVANIGAQTMPSTGQQVFATVQGSKTINPGLYMFAVTGNAATATFGTQSQSEVWISNASRDTSAGGALPASIAAGVISVSRSGWSCVLY